MLNNNINRKPLSRDEFLLATQVTSAAPKELWEESVASLIMTIAVSSEDTMDRDQIVYVVQQLGLTMPLDLLMKGARRIETVAAAIEAGIDPRTLD